MSLLDITAVLTSWNNKALTLKSLETFLSSRVPLKILICDDCSTDGTVELLKETIPTLQTPHIVQLISHKKHVGFAGLCNSGLREAVGDYILFTQNDVFVRPETIGNAIAYLNTVPKTGILTVGGGFIIGYNLYEITQFNGDELGGYHNVRDFDHFEVDFAAGFFMLCPLPLLQRYGICFDEKYDPYWEDVDWTRQITSQGFKCIMVSKKHVPYIHLRSASITSLLGIAERERRRNLSWLHYKSKWPAMQSENYRKYARAL